MRFEPSGDLETPYVFEQVVVGGAVPKNYFPAVEKGLQECVQKGPLAAYPVVGVKATLYDGSYPSGRFFRNGIQDGNHSCIQERLYGCISGTS